MANSIVGLDIGHAGVKGIKILPQKRGADLQAFAKQPLHKEVVDRGKVLDEGVVTKALEEVLNDIRPGKSRFVTAISAEQAVIRTLKIPAMSEKELRETVPWEIEQYLSYPVDEAALDFVVMKNQEIIDPADNMLDVLVVATPKEIVESYLKPLYNLGINPTCLDLQPYALVHNFLYFNPDNKQNVALIDMGASTTDILILEGNEIVLTRTISLGGDDFSHTLADKMSTSFQEAERYKMEELKVDSVLDELLVPLAEEFVQEITRSLGYFQIQKRGQSVDQIYLTGGCARTGGFKEFLAKNLNVNLGWWELDPFLNVPQRILDNQSHLKDSLMVSLGLAVSEVMF